MFPETPRAVVDFSPVVLGREDARNAGFVAADPEFARVLRVCEPGPLVLPVAAGAPTFTPPAAAPALAWRAAWREWQETLFAAVLAPALARAATFAAHDNARELRDVDLALARALPPEARDRARRSGQRLLDRLASARAARWVTKFHAWAAHGETPALLPTVYAGQCAMFHFPLRPTLMSYAYLEWRSAARQLDQPEVVAGEPAAALAPLRPLIEQALAAPAAATVENGGHLG